MFDKNYVLIYHFGTAPNPFEGHMGWDGGMVGMYAIAIFNFLEV